MVKVETARVGGFIRKFAGEGGYQLQKPLQRAVVEPPAKRLRLPDEQSEIRSLPRFVRSGAIDNRPAPD